MPRAWVDGAYRAFNVSRSPPTDRLCTFDVQHSMQLQELGVFRLRTNAAKPSRFRQFSTRSFGTCAFAGNSHAPMGQVQLLCAVRVRVDAQHAAKGKRSAVLAPVQIQEVRIGVDLDSNLGWLVYDPTHSALALGLVGLAAFLPAIALALVTGHVADRFDRHLIVATCHALNAMAAAGLLAVVWSGKGAVAPVYALVMLFGVAWHGTTGGTVAGW
jgi:hypothetical protein